MHTCPDCGSIIMEGDPYCTHCGAHLSWSDDYGSQGRSNMGYSDFDDSLEKSLEFEKRHQELINKICEKYKVELEDLDIKDGYTEYIFLRKTPYYTLKIVATDQYGGMIGIINDATRVDFTKILENRDYQEMIKDLGPHKLTTGLYRDEMHIVTQDAIYQIDMENKKLIEVKKEKVT